MLTGIILKKKCRLYFLEQFCVYSKILWKMQSSHILSHTHTVWWSPLTTRAREECLLELENMHRHSIITQRQQFTLKFILGLVPPMNLDKWKRTPIHHYSVVTCEWDTCPLPPPQDKNQERSFTQYTKWRKRKEGERLMH